MCDNVYVTKLCVTKLCVACNKVEEAEEEEEGDEDGGCRSKNKNPSHEMRFDRQKHG